MEACDHSPLLAGPEGELNPAPESELTNLHKRDIKHKPPTFRVRTQSDTGQEELQGSDHESKRSLGDHNNIDEDIFYDARTTQTPEFEEDPDFVDALTELSSDDYAPESTPQASGSKEASSKKRIDPSTGQPAPAGKTLARAQSAGSEKGSKTERAFAALLAWGLNRGKIRAKISTQSTRAVQTIKDQVKSLTKHSGRTKRIQSKEELRTLKAQKKAAKKSSKSEAVSYLKMLKAFKKIHAGTAQRHDMHLESLSLANGQYNLSNVDLGVTQVKLIPTDDGKIRPQITADINGILEIPLPGQAPLKVRLNMKDVQISLEGRLVPAANAWIGSYGLKDTLSQLQKIRGDSGGLFNLRHIGVKAGAIHATLLDPQPETLSAFRKRLGSTRGRAIDRLFVSLGLPLNIEVADLQVNVEHDSQPASSLLKVRRLKSDYVPPKTGTRDKDTPHGRELSIHADRIEVRTDGLSEQLIDTAKLLATENMLILPGTAHPEGSPLAALADKSTHLEGHVSDFNLTLGREVKHNGQKLELTGKDTLEVHTGPFVVYNEGKAHFSVTGDSVTLVAGRKDVRSSFSLTAKQCEASGNIKQALPKQAGHVDLKGDITAEEFHLSRLVDGDEKDIEVSTRGLTVKTDDRASQIAIGKTEVTLPSVMSAEVESLKLVTRSEKNSAQAKLVVGTTTLKSDERLAVKSETRNFIIPVDGEVTTTGTSIEWHKKAEGEHGQTTQELMIKPGTTRFKNICLDQLRIEEGKLDLDDKLTGELVLTGLEFNGSQLLSESSPIPKKVRDKIPEFLLMNRSLRLSLKLPVKEGKIDMSQAQIKGFQFDHQGANNNSWTGAGTKFLLDKAGDHCSLQKITVNNGRAWVEIDIAGYPVWLPTLKVPGYNAKDDNTIHLPELLHGLSGAHMAQLTDIENRLIRNAETGDLEAVYEMLNYCDSVDSEKSCLILKRLDINPWLNDKSENAADKIEALVQLNPYFRQYPEMAGKALAMSLHPAIPVSQGDIDYFTQKAIRSRLNPTTLAALYAKLGDYDTAYDVVRTASEKYPSDASYAYATAKTADACLSHLPKAEKTKETVHQYEQAIVRSFVQAARLGHKEAVVQLNIRAQQGNPLARIGLAGLLLTKYKAPVSFYEAMSWLEPLAGNNEDPIAQKMALDTLQRRARNATKIFLHAEENSDDLLAEELSKLGTIKETELSGKKLYFWGLRYLYGIEGVKQNEKEAKRLLLLAIKEGVKQAETHLLVVNRLQETAV
ncbi:hypothetical protein EOPP23_15535 [Endozoicomonas sp. OPT23]|nr:hypothetical protein [Endozoicomonas sp. OPT23]